MSFKFNWDGLPSELNEEALDMLTQALNKGDNKPPNLVGPIIAKELDLGSTPPQLDILEISELEEDRFRAMFRMKYEGDGFLVLQTKVQANPLRLPASELPSMPSIGVVAAAQPLVVPMLLRISGLKLHGIIVLAVSKQDGITLVFRSDPLVSVEVHSTFDSVPSVRSMLQREIEATLRSLFQEDLPIIVHEMSVNELRRARELKDRQRREHIEKQQQRIRMNHAQSDSTVGDMWSPSRNGRTARSDSGAASVDSLPQSVSQHLMTTQLHRRLMELSTEEQIRNHLARQNQNFGHEQGNPELSRACSYVNSLANSTYGGNMDDAGLFTNMGTVISGSRSNVDWAQTPPEFDTASLAAHSVFSYDSHGARTDYFLPPPPALSSHPRSTTFDENRMSGDPESLEQFLSDDWGRMQQSAELDAYIRRRQEERALNEKQNGVILRSTNNAVAARLASLMSMGQTLSPYTRRFEHTTMRSDVAPRLSQTPYRGASSRYIGVNGTQSETGAQPLSPGSPTASHDLRNFSFSSNMLPVTAQSAATSTTGAVAAAAAAGTSAGASFSSTTPPLGSGVHSPFSRNRKLRRKVHRINGLSLGNSASKNPAASSSTSD
ncbi:ERMES complex subunit [Coemansia sp. RSA 1813]|nr:ERMES complex subunit [Coemansia sp. RSA 1843]KAJ2087583.1 ERMES complex subunit [Coemansia sp. RSA 986]KAJ2212535.1 ERMES complex subunit [Coemansia sp. RSA 487]KAJ2566892.1 ERMES complex subunit [Coemansia sp. RSA 1813]